MKSGLIVFTLSAFILFMAGCSPKEVQTDPAMLSEDSKAWIPFEGSETVNFICEEDTITFTGTGKTSWFETERYMSDQGGFITVQEDYYSDLERQELIFESPESPYKIKYFLEKSKGETGEWDMLHISLSDGNIYTSEIRMVIFETDDFPKAENFQHKAKVSLNGITFSDIYYLKQERRPFELYYSQSQGIIGFKLSANELYSIQ